MGKFSLGVLIIFLAFFPQASFSQYEGEPIDIFGEVPEKSDRDSEGRHDRGGMDREPQESKKDRKKREKEKKRKIDWLKKERKRLKKRGKNCKG
ncbi:hypothetical protein [Sessilibacter corallicola]|uniref:Uncharacterized protein n=1 Tax=Sessilibacter corallicola TaxID=2904075 RepID=A0ABQ0A9U9_9GAMM